MLGFTVDHKNAECINCQSTQHEKVVTEIEQLESFTDSKPVLANSENHISLLPNLHYHGFDYTLVCRGRRSCVYRQMLKGETIGFEVSLIKIKKEVVVFGKICKTHERWAKDDDFGKTAFAYVSLDKAMERFNKFEK